MLKLAKYKEKYSVYKRRRLKMSLSENLGFLNRVFSMISA
jgi:hypothetical protein